MFIRIKTLTTASMIASVGLGTLITTVAFCLLVLTTVGCKRGSAPSTSAAQQTSASASPQQNHAEGGATTVPSETKYFKGSIGNTLDLQMKLVKTGDQISGHYVYQKIGTKISLRGTVDNTGNIVLQEFDPSNKQTGEFRGVWTTNKEDNLASIAGNWSKPPGDKNADKKTAFSVHEEPIFLTGNVEILNKQIKESNKKLMYEIDANYPEITGSSNPNTEKLNQVLRGFVTKQVATFKKEMAPKPDEEPRPQGSMGSDINVAYTIALAQDDLVSIQFDVGSYYQGAAHPNSYTEVVNYDLKNGKQLKLADVFKAGAKYLQALSIYCIEDLKKQAKQKGSGSMLEDASIKEGAGPTSKNYESWTITKKGLGINFDSYQVGPYAAGPQFVMVPYSAIKEHVNPDGPLGQFVK
ncbi:MAG TPA: DUF3298 and DUF4163 domain-containing protein [Pyrinomonadaceae bacterium]